MDGDNTLEYSILAILAAFLLLHFTMLAIRPYLGEPLASRPTFVANQIHCTTVSLLSLYLLVTKPGNDVSDFKLWQTIGIPISVAYFLADILWYCVPTGDKLILCHHITMILCHYPAGSPHGATFCGLGDAMWSVKLSMLGYLCELANPLMNYRWWLLQTLEKNRIDFPVVNVMLVVSFALRGVLLVWLLARMVLPRAAEFIEAKQVFIYTLAVLGHVIILLLTLYWLKVLCRGGLKSLLVFKKPEKKGGKFTFGTDMGRAEKKAAQPQKKTPQKKSSKSKKAD